MSSTPPGPSSSASIVVSGVGITAEAIADILRSHFSDRAVTVQQPHDDNSSMRSKSNNFIETTDLSVRLSGKEGELEETTKKLKQVTVTSDKARLSIQSFHSQQKALFDEFVLLRQR